MSSGFYELNAMCVGVSPFEHLILGSAPILNK